MSEAERGSRGTPDDVAASMPKAKDTGSEHIDGEGKVSEENVKVGDILPFLRRNGALILVLALGATLRIVGLTNESFWIDESMTAARSRWPFMDMIDNISGLDHMPFYFVMMWLVGQNLGVTELSMRAPSVLFGVLTILPIYLTGKRFDRRIGLTAALFVSLSPTLIYYSQEARMYSLFLFLVSVSVLLTFEWIAPFYLKDRKKAGIWVAVIDVLIVYTHYFGLFFIALKLSVLALLHLLERRKVDMKEVLSFLKGVRIMIVPLLSFIPWFIYSFLFHSTGDERTSGGLHLRLSLVPRTYLFTGGAYNTLEHTFSLEELMFAISSLTFLIMGALILLARRRKERYPLSISLLMFLTILVPPVIIYLLSVIIVPVYSHRYFIFMVPFLSLVSAIGFHEIFSTMTKGRKLLFSSLCAVLILAPGVISDLDMYGTVDKNDWRTALEHIGSGYREGDIIVPVPPYEQMTVLFYLPEANVYVNGTGNVTQLDDHQRIWVVSYRTTDLDSVDIVRTLWSRPVLENWESGTMKVRLYGKTPDGTGS